MPWLHRRRKGQNLIVEEVILVGISIVVLSGIVAMFSIMEDRVGESIREVSGKVVGESIVFNIERMMEYNNKGSVSLSIPVEIGSQGYSIIVNGNKLFLRFENGESHAFELYGSTPVVGGSSSAMGRITLRHNGTAIIIGG